MQRQLPRFNQAYRKSTDMSGGSYRPPTFEWLVTVIPMTPTVANLVFENGKWASPLTSYNLLSTVVQKVKQNHRKLIKLNRWDDKSKWLVVAYILQWTTWMASWLWIINLQFECANILGLQLVPLIKNKQARAKEGVNFLIRYLSSFSR